MDKKDLILSLKKIIEDGVVLHESIEKKMVGINGQENQWMFNFREVALSAKFLDIYADIFWEKFSSKYPFQVGGLETTGIALVAAIVLKGEARGIPVNGFYMRKSRKPDGLQKIIEGKLTNDPVILVDDLINSGVTFIKQIAILEGEHRKITDFFSILNFYPLDKYVFAKEKNIKIISLFSPETFGLSIATDRPFPRNNSFTVQWAHQYSKKPNYYYRVPKSAPIIDKEKVYFGSDDGVMRALNQTDGSEAWSFKMLGFGVQGKTIFSSPALYDGVLYFGAYDGNFYALDAETGKKKWIYMDADWIGSSPCVAEDLGLVYVGLEYGLFWKKGGIVALDAKTGEKKWECISMPEYTHGSPAYSKNFGVVAIGSNDGCLYLFKATDGKLLWKFQTGGEIKAAPAFDEKRGYVIFGSHDGRIYVVDIKTGKKTFEYATGASIYSTPLVSGEFVYVSSLDKKIYCINLDTFELKWSFTTAGRVFAPPTLINGYIYVGSNDGRLYELDAETGRNTAFFQTTERITNKIAYNKDTGQFFVLTYANELYCLKKKK